MIKFSILVLLYKSDMKSILLTLKSIALQDLKDYEIVVSDDGTHCMDIPEIEAFMNEYGITYYKLLDNEVNRGTVCHISEALKSCSGKYIKPIGAGDLLYDKGVLTDIWNFMEDGNKEFAFGRLQSFYFEDGKIVFNNSCNPPMNKVPYLKDDGDKIYRSVLFHRDFVSGASLFIRKDIFESYLSQITGKIRYAEDYIQLLATADGIRIRMLDRYVVYYESASGISREAPTGNSRLDPDRKKIWELVDERTTDEKLKKNIRYWAKFKSIKGDYVKSAYKLTHFPSAYVFKHERKKCMRELKTVNEGFLSDPNFANAE